MPKYRVVLGEVADYMIVVDADNEDAAGELAEQIMCNEGVTAFQCEVHNREVSSVEVAE